MERFRLRMCNQALALTSPPALSVRQAGISRAGESNFRASLCHKVAWSFAIKIEEKAIFSIFYVEKTDKKLIPLFLPAWQSGGGTKGDFIG